LRSNLTTEAALHPKLDIKNWVCDSNDAKAALQSILDANDAATSDKKMYIGHVAPVFDLEGEQILPDQFPDLKGAVVEVAVTISHEVMNGEKGKSDNFYADLSYITILQRAPASPVSPLKKRGLYAPPHHLAKKRQVE